MPDQWETESSLISTTTRKKTMRPPGFDIGHNLWSDWAEIVGQYSSAHLTSWEDRLVAISGIAKKLQTVLNDEYCAGLWKRRLVEDLAWKANGYGTRTQLLLKRDPPVSFKSLLGHGWVWQNHASVTLGRFLKNNNLLLWWTFRFSLPSLTTLSKSPADFFVYNANCSVLPLKSLIKTVGPSIGERRKSVPGS
jgi:hypothetical protein